MIYQEAKARKAELQSRVDLASDKLNEFPKSASGLVSDCVRNTEEFKSADLEFRQSFAALQNFNKQYVKVFKKEIQAERRERFA